MKYEKLGRSGLWISSLCLGTMNFGMETDEKEAFKIMDAALEAGINFFDTADVYGGDGKAGATEALIGRWFARGNGRRERVVLATKVYGEVCDKYEGPNDKRGLSAYKIHRHLEASLNRLQTDHVELYYMHHIDRSVGWDELWNAFEREIKQNKITYIGSSNFAGWDLAVAQSEAAKHNFPGIICEQHKYNLRCRIPELEVLPSAQAHGIGIIPWSPLDGGILSRNALKKLSGGRSSKAREYIEKHRDQLQEFSDLCSDLSAHEDTVALSWLLHSDAVPSVVIGPRTLQQFEDSLKSLELSLSPETLQRIDRIFPGPGGPAPNAYSW